MGLMKQYDVILVNLDPTAGAEIQKIRPCVIISPDEMNRNIKTLIIAPMTTKEHSYPTRIPLQFEDKKAWIVLDQIRTIDKQRVLRSIGSVTMKTIENIKTVLTEMLIN
jgi:mRNA interferase MazF